MNITWNCLFFFLIFIFQIYEFQLKLQDGLRLRIKYQKI